MRTTTGAEAWGQHIWENPFFQKDSIFEMFPFSQKESEFSKQKRNIHM
jgi:hypothetical protein